MSTIDKLAYVVFILLAAASSGLFIVKESDYAFALLVLMVLFIGFYTVKARHYFGTLRSRAIENLDNTRQSVAHNLELAKKIELANQNLQNTRQSVAHNLELAKKIELANQNLQNELSAASEEIQHTRQELSDGQNANIKKTLSTLEALRASTDKTAQKIYRLGQPTQQLTKIIWEDTQQLQAYMQLLPRISPRWAMPPLGRWALDAKSMLNLALLIEEHKPRTIVELGSGSSTVWLSYFVEQYGGKVHSFDHLAQYQQQTYEYLKKHELETTASVIEAPLKPYTIDDHEYSWYDLQALEQIESIDLLIIDGPPGGTQPWARYPAVPLLHHKLTPNALVILDDSDRQDEAEIIEQWRHDFPAVQQKEQGIGRLSVLYGFTK